MQRAPLSPVTSMGNGCRLPTKHPLRGGCFVSVTSSGEWIRYVPLVTSLPCREELSVALRTALQRGGLPAVTGTLCSAQGHPIPAGSHFPMLAPSGPLGVELHGAALPLSACQPLPPAPGRAPVSRRARLLYLPTSSPRTRTCDDYTQHPALPTAESPSERRKPEPRPPPSRRPPLGPHPHP